jgi:hypothetical protein
MARCATSKASSRMAISKIGWLLPQGDVQRDRPRDSLAGRISTGEFGDFEVTLTHYGQRVRGGGCVTFFATVEGLITFTLTP